jgi:hypothetical protein
LDLYRIQYSVVADQFSLASLHHLQNIMTPIKVALAKMMDDDEHFIQL